MNNGNKMQYSRARPTPLPSSFQSSKKEWEKNVAMKINSKNLPKALDKGKIICDQVQCVILDFFFFYFIIYIFVMTKLDLNDAIFFFF